MMWWRLLRCGRVKLALAGPQVGQFASGNQRDDENMGDLGICGLAGLPDASREESEEHLHVLDPLAVPLDVPCVDLETVRHVDRDPYGGLHASLGQGLRHLNHESLQESSAYRPRSGPQSVRNALDLDLRIAQNGAVVQHYVGQLGQLLSTGVAGLDLATIGG